MLAYGTMPDAPDHADLTSPGSQMDRLVEIMRILRSPDGCPWDREQTLDSLRPYIVEEAYEVLEAIEASDPHALRDELGDLLLEVVFVAQISAEDRQFTIADALSAVCEKLVRRHPHVFDAETDARTGSPVRSAADVRVKWESIKAREREAAGASVGVLGSLPAALPALLRAYRMGRRAATVGFDWTQASDVVGKVREELAEVEAAVRDGQADAIAEELGDLLLAVASLSRHHGVEPEGALRQANDKFARRFEELERRFAASGRTLEAATLTEMETEWNDIKIADPSS